MPRAHPAAAAAHRHAAGAGGGIGGVTAGVEQAELARRLRRAARLARLRLVGIGDAADGCSDVLALAAGVFVNGHGGFRG